ncbi:MAG: hypothetical protein ABI120_25740 [Gemmatimonadaceae bacterium]
MWSTILSGARSGEPYFWATHAGAKLDLLIVRGKTRIGFEFKRTTSPAVTSSMRSAIGDLRLDPLYTRSTSAIVRAPSAHQGAKHRAFR